MCVLCESRVCVWLCMYVSVSMYVCMRVCECVYVCVGVCGCEWGSIPPFLA